MPWFFYTPRYFSQPPSHIDSSQWVILLAQNVQLFYLQSSPHGLIPFLTTIPFSWSSSLSHTPLYPIFPFFSLSPPPILKLQQTKRDETGNWKIQKIIANCQKCPTSDNELNFIALHIIGGKLEKSMVDHCLGCSIMGFNVFSVWCQMVRFPMTVIRTGLFFSNVSDGHAQSKIFQ